MANGNGLLGSSPGDFQGLLGDPLFNIGIGLLTSGLSRPQTVGQGLAQGLQTGTGLQQQSSRNQLLREGLLEKQQQRETLARRQAANQKLIDTFFPESAGVSDVADAPISLLGGMPGQQLASAQGGAPAQPSQRQIMGLLAEANPDAFQEGLLSQVFAAPEKPTTFQRDFEFLVTEKGLTQAEALDRLNKGTTVNVGEKKMDEPISVNDLENIRGPNGETLPIGTTYGQARAAGARVLSSDEIQTGQKAEDALALLDELETLALGTEGQSGIFTDVEPGFVNRAKSALDFGLDLVEQNDPRASRFKDLGEGSISTFVKMLGEKGALAEGDVSRAIGLLPRLFPLPDTGEVAKEKLKTLRGIIDRGVRNLNRGELPGRKTADAPKTNTLPGTAEELGEMSDEEVLRGLGIR